MAEIQPGDPSYTLTELLHAVNIMIYMTGWANWSADNWRHVGLYEDDGYTCQHTTND